MRVKTIELVDNEHKPLSLPKNSVGKLFVRTYLPMFFETNLDGSVDVQIQVHGVEFDSKDLEPHPGSGPAPDLFGDVGRFHEKFGVRVAGQGAPSFPSPAEVAFRSDFLTEELTEFQDGVRERDMAKVADSLADLVWVALGTAHVFGIPFPAIWAEVVRANMAKERAIAEGDDRSKRDAAFDIVKPAGWVPPDHSKALGL